MLYDCNSNLGILVARGRKLLRREFEAHLAPYDLTVPQIAVLWSLWETDGKTVGQLSTWVASDAPTLTSLLDRMEAKDLIRRERDPKDRRTVRVYLCEKGKTVRERVMSAGEQVEAVVRHGMTEQQVEQLRQLLLLLCTTLEGGEVEGYSDPETGCPLSGRVVRGSKSGPGSGTVS